MFSLTKTAFARWAPKCTLITQPHRMKSIKPSHFPVKYFTDQAPCQATVHAFHPSLDSFPSSSKSTVHDLHPSLDSFTSSSKPAVAVIGYESLPAAIVSDQNIKILAKDTMDTAFEAGTWGQIGQTRVWGNNAGLSLLDGIEELKKDFRALHLHVDQKDDDIRALKDDNRALNLRVDQKDDDIRALKDDNRALNLRVDQKDDDIRALENDNSALNLRIDQKDDDIRALNLRVDQKDDDIRALKDDNCALKNDNRALKNNVRELQSEVVILKTTSEGYLSIRNRFLDVYRRDILGEPDAKASPLIQAGNRAAHNGDAVVDSYLFLRGLRTDESLMAKVYGLSPKQVESLDAVGDGDSIELLNQFVTIKARKNRPVPRNLKDSFKRYITILRDCIGEMPQDDPTSPLGKAYRDFWAAYEKHIHK